MDPTRLKWIKDMNNANLLIHKNDALFYEDGKAVGIDPLLMHEGFLDYYAGLTSVGYANGWI